MNDQVIKKLTEREHILARPGMYLGSTNYVESEEFILNGEGKFTKKSVRYVPCLLKIINEIIDNSVDEAVRTNFEFATKIKVNISDNEVTILDNGRGIPVKKVEGTDQYMPVIAFTEARSGANFEDEGRMTIGMNGVGSFATNCFSKWFKVSTADGANRLNLDCSNNCETFAFDVHKNSQRFTKVNFEPDFSRLEVKSIDETHLMLIRQRMTFLSLVYKHIDFYLNDDKISFNNTKQFLSLFHDNCEFIEGEGWMVAVFPSDTDDFSSLSYINGIHVKNGGNHVNFIAQDLIARVRSRLNKKFDSLKPADMKNKLSMFFLFNGFPNCKFDSQTKENLTNSVDEIKDYLKWGTLTESLEKFAKSVYKNNAIMDPVLEIFKIKEEFKNRQLIERTGVKKRVVSDKYFPPIGDHKFLFLCEGDSACGGCQKIFGRKDIGYFALRGKPLNSFDSTIQKIVSNNELKTIIDILGLDLATGATEETYSIVFATDQDLDGFHIRGLLLAFFNRFGKDLVKNGRIAMLQTPIMVLFEKEKPKKWFYSIGDYTKYIEKNPLTKNQRVQYYKGLGSHKSEDLKYIIEQDGLENMIQVLTESETSDEAISTWMSGSRADDRKEELKDKAFDLSSL